MTVNAQKHSGITWWVVFIPTGVFTFPRWQQRYKPMQRAARQWSHHTEERHNGGVQRLVQLLCRFNSKKISRVIPVQHSGFAYKRETNGMHWRRGELRGNYYEALNWENEITIAYLKPHIVILSLLQVTTSGCWIVTGCQVHPEASPRSGASRHPLTPCSPAVTARARRTFSR